MVIAFILSAIGIVIDWKLINWMQDYGYLIYLSFLPLVIYLSWWYYKNRQN